MSAVIVTTTPNVEGRKITSYQGIVKYLKLKWMNPSIEHRELMLA